MYKKNKYLNNPIIFEDIQFKSQLEVRLYKTLIKLYKNVEYESKTFELVPTIRCYNIPFYNRIGKTFKQDTRPLRSITYTPDFSFVHNGITVYVEAKGMENDVFPYKRQLFRRFLENLNKPVMYFEVRTVKEIMEMDKILQKESSDTLKLRQLLSNVIPDLFAKYIKLLEAHDWNKLKKLLQKVNVNNNEINYLLDEKIK